MRKIFLISMVTLFIFCSTGYAELVDNGDGTMTDTKTGLMWQKAESGNKNWKEAISYCETLGIAGHSDWRLPNIDELKAIADYRTKFHDAMASMYWSSTTYDYDSDYAWILVFMDSCVYRTDKQRGRNVKAVRGRQ